MPRQFKRYQSYKPYLQVEFTRVCVYCRQPDSSAPNLNFGVDHYRPKRRFANLVCSYENLYYCCANCNTRKSDYWPDDEAVGPYIVNPCDYEMATHLRFDGKTGLVEAKTPDGQYTEELLQLNEDATVQYRLSALTLVRVFSKETEKLQDQLKALARQLRAGQITQIEYESEERSINHDLADLLRTIQAHTGELPLRPLRRRLNGVDLLLKP